MRRLDRSNPLPLWAQLLDVLRERIERGDFSDGFPTDAQLLAEYDVSRHTVRDAVRRLQDDGLVVRERGRGSRIATPRFEQPSGALYSLFRSIEALGMEQRSDVISFGELSDPDVAANLELGADQPLVRLERLRRAGGQALAHDVVWMPADIGRKLLEVDFSHTALYDQLAQCCGVHVSGGTEWVRAVVADPDECQLLEMAPGSAAFSILRRSCSGGRPVEWRTSLVRGDLYSFVATWSPTTEYSSVLTEASPVPRA